MKWYHQIRLFQKAVVGILITFMGLMVAVTIFAYSRRSGFTKQDMAEAPLIRAKAIEQLVAERQKKSL